MIKVATPRLPTPTTGPRGWQVGAAIGGFLVALIFSLAIGREAMVRFIADTAHERLRVAAALAWFAFTLPLWVYVASRLLVAAMGRPWAPPLWAKVLWFATFVSTMCLFRGRGSNAGREFERVINSNSGVAGTAIADGAYAGLFGALPALLVLFLGARALARKPLERTFPVSPFVGALVVGEALALGITLTAVDLSPTFEQIENKVHSWPQAREFFPDREVDLSASGHWERLAIRDDHGCAGVAEPSAVALLQAHDCRRTARALVTDSEHRLLGSISYVDVGSKAVAAAITDQFGTPAPAALPLPLPAGVTPAVARDAARLAVASPARFTFAFGPADGLLLITVVGPENGDRVVLEHAVRELLCPVLGRVVGLCPRPGPLGS